MGEKDIAEKVLADYNDVFSDIINVLLFNGDRRVKEDSLVTESPVSQYKADDSRLHEQERDVSKYWSEGKVQFALFGLEHQTKIDKNMPLRVISYDGAAYRSMLLKKTKPVPVITIVLYFGTEKKWENHLSLSDEIDIPDELVSYVNDYRIHVVNVAWLSEETIEKFQSDFGIVADFFRRKRIDPKNVGNNKKIIKHVDEMLKLLSVLTKDERYYDQYIKNEKKKEGLTMCEVLDSYIDRGIKQGIEKGKEQGIKQGMEKGIEQGIEQGIERVALNMLERNMSNEEILSLTGLSVEKIVELKEKMVAE